MLPDENAENIIEQMQNAAVFVEGVPGPLKFGDTFTLFGAVAARVRNNYIGKLPRVLELFTLPDVEGLTAEWAEEEGFVTIAWTGSDTYLTAVEVSVDNGDWVVAGFNVGVNEVTGEEDGTIVDGRARFVNFEGEYSPNYAIADTISIGLPVVTTDDLDMGFAMNGTATGTVVSEGDSSINSYGFVYAMHDSPTLDDHVVEVGTGSFTGEFNDNINFAGADPESVVYVAAYATNGDGTSYGDVLSGEVQICLMAGTLITLSTGKVKKIEDVRYDDMLLTWNFDEARLTQSKPVWIVKPFSSSKHGLIKFSNGAELGTVADGRGHRLFNVGAGKFTHMMNGDTPLGTITVDQYNQPVTVVGKTLVHQKTIFYNVIAHTHLNVFANGILTSTGLNNLYPIEGMRFVKQDRVRRNRLEFSGVSLDMFHGLRLDEQPVGYPGLKEKIERMTRRQLHHC